MPHVYCSMLNGTSQAEATSDGEITKPVALAIVEVDWSDGIWQLVCQSLENFIKK